MGWPYDDLIEKIYLPHFQKYGESSIPGLVNYSVSTKAFLSAYKKLKPIEEMPEIEKSEMKQYVRKLFKDKTPKEKLEACKVIYTIGTLG